MAARTIEPKMPAKVPFTGWPSIEPISITRSPSIPKSKA
jgi:hypothetical protein